MTPQPRTEDTEPTIEIGIRTKPRLHHAMTETEPTAIEQLGNQLRHHDWELLDGEIRCVPIGATRRDGKLALCPLAMAAAQAEDRIETLKRHPEHAEIASWIDSKEHEILEQLLEAEPDTERERATSATRRYATAAVIHANYGGSATALILDIDPAVTKDIAKAADQPHCDTGRALVRALGSPENRLLQQYEAAYAEAYGRYDAGSIRWAECLAVERDPERLNGAWRFTGTDVPLARLFHALAAGTGRIEFATRNELDKTAPAQVLEFIAHQLNDAEDATWEHGGPRGGKTPALQGGPKNRDDEQDPETTHWKDCSAAWRNTERMSGSWCIATQRFPLAHIFRGLSYAKDLTEFLGNYTLTREQVVPVLQFLADELGRPLQTASETAPTRHAGE